MFVRGHADLKVYQRAFQLAMEVFELSKQFPKVETYSLTDQARRSSRSVAANIAEAWEKRRYEGSFIAKLIDSAGEAAETQNWLRFAIECGYLDAAGGTALVVRYTELIGTIQSMVTHSSRWTGTAS